MWQKVLPQRSFDTTKRVGEVRKGSAFVFGTSTREKSEWSQMVNVFKCMRGILFTNSQLKQLRLHSFDV